MTLEPQHLSSSAIRRRRKDYIIAASQINRMLKNRNWETIFIDNSVSEESLLTFLNELNLDIAFKAHTLNRNLGKLNKGIGELDMLNYIVKNDWESIKNSKMIVYFTGRRIITNHYLIEKVENTELGLVISNPPFLNIKGDFEISASELINDMFFSMTPDLLRNYANFCNRKIEIEQRTDLGSEQLLYLFVKSLNMKPLWLDSLGLLRREEKKVFWFFPRVTYHII